MADDAGRLNQVFAETSFLYGANAAFIEDLHARWADDPARQRQIDRLAQLILGWWRSDPQGVEHGAVLQG